EVRLALCQEAISMQERLQALARRLFEVQLGAQVLAQELALKDARLEEEIKNGLILQGKNAALEKRARELEIQVNALEYRLNPERPALRAVG
ncbi:MAG TPA: hypothetical protein VF803_01440, partial [Candidatus Paceibacterota bacterium]